MAKGQKKSNREIKKPKAEKKKPEIAVSRFTVEPAAKKPSAK